MIDKRQLRRLIADVLNALELHSDVAVDLLMGTASVESHLGTFISQVGGGPARGIMQMEPATERDIWENYIAFRLHLVPKIIKVCGVDGPGPWLKYNLAYQIAMARLHYLRVPEPLPDPGDEVGLAEYWKKHYNTPQGHGTVEKFVDNYQFVR